MTTRLHAAHLSQPNIKATIPRYTPSEHGVGIVHIGIGAFHRGHQAVFTDDAIAQSGGDWRIAGVSLRSAAVSGQLNPQNGLYTVIEKSEAGNRASIIGAVQEVLCAKDEASKVIDYFASPATHIVTLTVTEKGYHFDQSNGGINWDSQDIQHDVANPDSPVSMPGYLVLGCKTRMHKAASAKLTVISCDNLPENGRIVESIVHSLAANQSTQLLEWIKHNVTFCSSMVDRIVPSVTKEDIQEQANALGYIDKGLIITEPFKQWVVEDNFRTPRPDWESAGVLFVSNVSDYEKLKLRTLNGSHSALAYMGVLLGHKWIHQAINDSLLSQVIKHLMEDETGPTVPKFEGFNLREYQQQIVARFENSHIAYGTQQVAMDGSQKLQQRILAPMAELYAQGKAAQTTFLMATLVCWLRYLKQENEMGERYVVCDPLAELLTDLVAQHSHSPQQLVNALCKQTSIIPDALKNNTDFRQRLIDQISLCSSLGVNAYLQAKVNQR
jgi:fructuronate reductase